MKYKKTPRAYKKQLQEPQEGFTRRAKERQEPLKERGVDFDYVETGNRRVRRDISRGTCSESCKPEGRIPQNALEFLKGALRVLFIKTACVFT